MKNKNWNFIKYFLTVFTAILIPIYWYFYGLTNFLWLSDIGLFLTVIGLWVNSTLIISIATVGILVIEIIWNIDFFFRLIFKIQLIGMADYMFDNSYPIFLRAISLFHKLTPIIWIVYLAKHGYDKRAFYYFIVLYWIDLTIIYFFTDPEKNINWVFLPQIYKLPFISQNLWLAILFFGFPILIFLPTHFLCKKIFKK